MSSNAAAVAEVFVYTGNGVASIPRDVVRVRVDLSVTSISIYAFFERRKLAEVELCEGLVEIGEHSFSSCYHSITEIKIPTSLRRINMFAFSYSLRTPIHLHDGIESIGSGAFSYCIFTNFRVPPLITVIPERMLHGCRAMFSLEFSKNVTEIGKYAFMNCFCLRNVAIPPNADIGDDIFDYDEMTDLKRLFGASKARVIRELQHRFHQLPIHSFIYYHSYTENVLQKLIAAINMRSGHCRALHSKLDPTGNQQDCLGMTPLHILACSSVHNLELYRVIVEKYPTNLITEDRWGALPLLYAFWGAAPAEIIEFLLESYQLIYPGHVFNWTMMVETLGRCDTPKERIEILLCVREIHFPEQPLDWEHLLDKFAARSGIPFGGAPFRERMQFLFTCGMSDRMEALVFKVWRDCIYNMIQTADYQWGRDNSYTLNRIRGKLAHFEVELQKLKVVTTILEIALWKIKLNEKSHHNLATQSQKKIKTDESSFRSQCRVTCGADVVIQHVLPYLL